MYNGTAAMSGPVYNKTHLRHCKLGGAHIRLGAENRINLNPKYTMVHPVTLGFGPEFEQWRPDLNNIATKFVLQRY